MKLPERTLILGGGVFGGAMRSLLDANGVKTMVVDINERAEEVYPLVVLSVPVAAMRQALLDNIAAFGDDTIIMSCSKGIEGGTLLFPHQIFAQVVGKGRYHALAGPSFAKEITDKVPTFVEIASVSKERSEVPIIIQIFSRPHFKLEEHTDVAGIELAGAMKNAYAIAAGYLAGLGGKANTHAHLLVVALREYRKLAEVLNNDTDVVRPSIIGDFTLTCGSTESRNYRYGLERANGGELTHATVEGANAVAPLMTLADNKGVSLPLLSAVAAIVSGSEAERLLWKALGFEHIDL